MFILNGDVLDGMTACPFGQADIESIDFRKLKTGMQLYAACLGLNTARRLREEAVKRTNRMLENGRGVECSKL